MNVWCDVYLASGIIKIQILQSLDNREFQDVRPITACIHLVNPIFGSMYLRFSVHAKKIGYDFHQKSTFAAAMFRWHAEPDLQLTTAVLHSVAT
jgi:hypothetical protein